MARKLKYHTQEERREARQAQNRAALARWRAKKRQSIASEHALRIPLLLQTIQAGAQSSKADDRSDADIAFEDLVYQLHQTSIGDLRRHSQIPIHASYPGLVYMTASVVEEFSTFPSKVCIGLQGTMARVQELCVFTQWATYTGAMLHDNSLIQKARVTNTQLLQIMQYLVSHAHKMRSISLLPATLNYGLSVIEIAYGAVLAEGADRKAALASLAAHANVAAEIVQSCGPKAFHSPLGMQILRTLRKFSVLVALAQGRACFLDSDHWRNNPCADDQPSSEDTLWCLVVKTPGLYTRVDALASSRNSHGSKLHLLEEAEALWNAITSLQADFESWYLAFSSMVYKPTPDIDLDPYVASPASEAFPFPSVEIARVLNTFYFYSFILGTLARTVTDQYNLIMSSPPLPQRTSELTTLSWRVCQTIRFSHKHDNLICDITIQHALLPLHYLMKLFKNDPLHYSAQLEWCTEMRQNIYDHHITGRHAQFVMDCHFPPDEEIGSLTVLD